MRGGTVILQALLDYYKKLLEAGEISEPGWCQAKVSFALHLGQDGSIQGIIPLKVTKQRGKKTVEVPLVMKVPEMQVRSVGICANFLCDNAKYMLGIGEPGEEQRTRKCFEAAREKHLEILEEVHSRQAEAVKAFFLHWDPEKESENQELEEFREELKNGGNLVFYVDHQYAQDDGMIQNKWNQLQETSQEDAMGRCLVTGEQTEIARIHSAIKGVPGAQSRGASLVSFNAPAFRSYEKEQSFNAPIGKYAMFAYTTALNFLLSNQDFTMHLGDTTVVFWSEDGRAECQNLFLAASEPKKDNQEIIEGVFRAISAGCVVDIDSVYQKIDLQQHFYILGLSPNAARLSIRFFHKDSFGNILKHLKEHYDRMKLVQFMKDQITYMGIWRLLQETIQQKSKEKKPKAEIAARVFEAVLSGGRYPEGLYYAVLERIRAEQDDQEKHTYKITKGRVAIIKAYLMRNHQELAMKGDGFVGLEENCCDVAYVLGREFAVLEWIQWKANRDVGATIKDRYFNSACATPGIVFPILFKLKNNHIGKLKESEARYAERCLMNLQGKLELFQCPSRLSLEQQGLFILGYYHQKMDAVIKQEEKEHEQGNSEQI